jgi:hypothetical protein
MQTRRRITAAIATLLLAGFSVWLLPFGWQQRHLARRDYAFRPEEARALRHYPEALMAYGQRALLALDPGEAARHYRAVVVRDPGHMAAWLKLAEAEAAAGEPTGRAREMVAFVARRAGKVMFWQWPTALLAHDLGLEEVFRGCINRLAARGWKLADTFNLADTHFRGDSAATLTALEPAGRPPYLEWLMRWGRLADARLAWQAINADGAPPEDIRSKFVNFLIQKKAVGEAAAIQRGSAGTGGMTNGRFEQAVTNDGFDWRWGRDPEGHWSVQQIFGQGRQGAAARVTFYGRDNIDFHHFYQIVPVTPGMPHQLSWWWRGQTLTTDQGPFLEIYGYDCPGFRLSGPMLTGSRDWHAETLAFTPPADCQAVVVRLRRSQSRRFDSKIAGTVWLDDMSLEITEDAARVVGR